MALDLDAHLHAAVLDVWGDPVQYQPLVSQPGAPAYPITAVFDREHQIVMDEIARSELSAAGHSTTAPVLSLQLSHLAAKPRQGDRVVVGTSTYTVWDVQPDGRGWADLILRQV